MKKTPLIILITFVSGLFLVSCGETPSPQKNETQKAVDALFSEWDKPGSPGASVAIIRNGQLLYSQGYGESQMEYEIPIEPKTIFHVASVSKQFTAFAIALLAERGELSLEDDVRKYIPEVPDFGTQITIRHLANHTSGIRDQWNLLGLAGWRIDDVITKDQVMKLVARQQDLNFPPNDQNNYSNTGYTLMAEIVERVGGKPFPQWMEENVFKPLGMTNSQMYDDHERVVPNRSYSYYKEGEEYKKSKLNYAIAGATSLFTTAEDLTLWLDNFRTHKLGGKAVFDDMVTKGVLNNGEELTYALGVVVMDYKGLPSISHSGGDAGFRSHVVYFPDQELGIAVLSNYAQFDPSGLAFKVSEIYLADHLPPKPDETPEPSTTSEDIFIAPEVLENYTGLYAFEKPKGLSIEVQVNDEGLIALDPAGVTHKLTPLTETSFSTDLADFIFYFENAEDGFFTLKIDVGEELIAHKVRPVNFSEEEMEAFEGEYFSPELETSYRIKGHNGKLIAIHPRHPDITLTPLNKITFNGSTWFFGETTFEKNEGGKIMSMLVSSGRVLNLKFEKVN